MTLWWGPAPWPRENYRAEVCANDEERTEIPVGSDCGLCGEPILEIHCGVTLGGIGANGQFELVHEHIECQMRTVMGCFELVSTGRVWTEDHVCKGQDNYREDALKVWSWIQTHPLG